MPVALIALAIGAFGIGLTEFVVAGILPQIARDFGVDIPTAGLMATTYALGVFVGAPILTVLGARVPRKTMLIALALLFTMGNILTAVAPSLPVALAGRVLTAFNHGTFFGIGSIIAASLVAKDKQARAIAFMFSGLTLANLFGVPAGTWIAQVKEKFGLHPERLIADTAYGTGPMLGWLVDRKIAPHIPVFDKSGRPDGTWTRADFEWDAQNDQYICPEGHELKQFRRNYSDPNRGPTGKGVAKYRGLKLTCQACPSKSRCCPNMDFRSITREEHEDARQVARDIAKTRQYGISMKLRKKVEMLFAHLKRILGLRRLRLRGPCGANDEFLLAATAQNLRKLAKIFPAPQQMQKA